MTIKEAERKAISALIDERKRQVNSEGFTPDHDDLYRNNELALAAVAYALPSVPFDEQGHEDFTRSDFFPWDSKWWKPSPENRKKELIKAGALILAALEVEFRNEL